MLYLVTLGCQIYWSQPWCKISNKLTSKIVIEIWLFWRLLASINAMIFPRAIKTIFKIPQIDAGKNFLHSTEKIVRNHHQETPSLGAQFTLHDYSSGWREGDYDALWGWLPVFGCCRLAGFSESGWEECKKIKFTPAELIDLPRARCRKRATDWKDTDQAISINYARNYALANEWAAAPEPQDENTPEDQSG